MYVHKYTHMYYVCLYVCMYVRMYIAFSFSPLLLSLSLLSCSKFLCGNTTETYVLCSSLSTTDRLSR